MLHKQYIVAPLVLAVLIGGGCRSVYYAAYDKIGVEKRHLLRSNIEKVQKEQTKTSEEFKDVLTQINELYAFDGGNLERFYRKLEGDYEDVEQRAESLRDRIDQVEQIAADMFSEWESEIEQMTTASLRRQSQEALRKTRTRYEDLARTMSKAEERMDPVLQKLHEYVLALKHQLNARAIGALAGEADAIEQDVLQLLDEMNRSISEADAFLSDF